MPVFPTAKGFGADWTFNSNYEVRVVNSLASSGNGSLLEAVNSSSTYDAVIIVFNGISGTIELSSTLQPHSGHQTYIAGQTSTNGILIKGNPSFGGPLLNTGGGHPGLIIRHIVFAIGATGNDNVNGDNISLNGGQNAILDHCSFLWSTDENMSPYGVVGFTMQNCILGQSLMYATHAYTTDETSSAYLADPEGPKPHSMGSLVGNSANNITYYRNLFAHNNQRNPLIGGSVDPGANHEIVQNIMYNWGSFGLTVGEGFNAEVNIINNYHVRGNNTSTSRYGIGVRSDVTVFSRDNITPERTSQSQDEYLCIGDGNVATSPIGASQQASNAFNYPLKDETFVEHTVLESMLTSTDKVGTKFNLPCEQQMIDTFINRNGTLINDPSDVGGYPTIASSTAWTDSDQNGIPDSETTWGDDTFGYVNYLADDSSNPVPVITLSELKAFPTAEGYGKNSTGGRGGTIYRVNNASELRNALEASGNREIVFGQGGLFDLGGTSINLGDGTVSVNGQTAPEDSGGVFIYGGEIESNGNSHITFRYVFIRAGDQIIGTGNDAVRIINYSSDTPQGNIIFDHCSVAWGSDETMSFGGNTSLGRELGNITVQKCILTQSFDGEKNLLFGDNMENISFLRNVFANAKERNPRSSYGYVNAEVINNVIYGNGQIPISFSYSMEFDVIGNIHITNSNTFTSNLVEFTSGNGSPPIGDSRAYINDNTTDGVNSDSNHTSSLSPYIEGSRINQSGTPLEPNTGTILRDSILDEAGNYLFRDAIDDSIIDDVLNGTGGFYISESEAGFASLPSYATGTPWTDTGNTGIEDSFKTAHNLTGDGTNITTNWDFGTYQVVNNAGYTDREIYWAWLAGDFGDIESEIPVIDDLQKRISQGNILFIHSF